MEQADDLYTKRSLDTARQLYLKALEQQGTVIDSVLWTRDVVNVPADTATPEWLSEEARALG